MKYSIQPRSALGINAGTKAVKDVSHILNELGYIPLEVGSNYNGNHIYRLFILVYDLIRLYTRASKEDIYFIQWPYYNYLMPLFYWIIKTRCKNIELLAHDINCIRGEKYGAWDMKFFNLSNLIIVHSKAMKQYLIDNGIISTKIKILTSFDYITNDKITFKRKNTNNIVYAGNLAKSPFLNLIKKNELNINCYGKEIKNLGEGVNYKTAFQPENVSILEGSWGLVWDGNSINECSGTMGEYLRYNAPHKLSLYIVAELPVIVWKNSAMADYVNNKNIGICISSINEISEKINNISDKEYDIYINNIKRESYELRQGMHLKKCLNREKW